MKTVCFDWLIIYFFILYFFLRNLQHAHTRTQGGGGGGGGGGGAADFKIEWGKNQNPTENRWTKKSHAEFLSRP